MDNFISFSKEDRKGGPGLKTQTSLRINFYLVKKTKRFKNLKITSLEFKDYIIRIKKGCR